MIYRREIDGLRALALLPVLFFHASFQTFRGGFVGVDVFFVISGYLITSIILVERSENTFALAGFYERRARRILPALFFVLLACLPFAWLWMMPSDMRDFSQSLAAVSLFSSNILFWRQSGYFNIATELKPLLHTWSLAVEEQYYLLFPIFLLILLRLGKRRTVGVLGLLLVVSLALAQWGSTIEPTATFYLLPTRGWELLIGALIGYYLYTHSGANPIAERIGSTASLALSAIGVLLICYAVLLFDKSVPFPGIYALAPTSGAAFVILFANERNFVGKLLGSRLLVGLGLISYSAYLWHQPLLALARHHSVVEPSAALRLLLLLVAIALAYLSWKFVEKPFRDRRRFSRAQIFAFSLIAMVLFLTIGLTGYLTGGFPIRFEDRVNVLASLTDREKKLREDDRCNVNNADFQLTNCVKGHVSKDPGFAIWGDSHAEALVDELSNAFASKELGFVQYTKNACPAALRVTTHESDGQDLNCDKYTTAVFQSLLARGINTVVLSSRWQWYFEGVGFDNGEGGIDRDSIIARGIDDGPIVDERSRKQSILSSYTRTVLSLLANKIKVVLIYPVPENGWNVPKTLAKRIIFGETSTSPISTDYQRYIARNQEVIKALDSIGERQYLFRIKPANDLCDTYAPGRCVAEWNNSPLYFDDNHVVNGGARLIVAEVMKVID
jgi:peptidoglycan/LPS O-acetylase OafA/YrhL